MYVGNQAPLFSAEAIVKDEIKNISLGDLKGHWVVLLFYSGDFTFV